MWRTVVIVFAFIVAGYITATTLATATAYFVRRLLAACGVSSDQPTPAVVAKILATAPWIYVATATAALIALWLLPAESHWIFLALLFAEWLFYHTLIRLPATRNA